MTIDCTDIYKDETNKSLKILKRFREAWLRSSSEWNAELFQYADSDFYFYRFAIDRQQRSTEPLLTKILYRVMERYGIDFQVLDDMNHAPFSFLICKDDTKVGYRFTDFNSDEDVNRIVNSYGLEKAFIIRARKTGRADEWMIRENSQYKDGNVKLESISLKAFFEEYFGAEEYNSFITCIESYLKDAREITGYTSIKFLSSMNLASQRAFADKFLAEWDYQNYDYQIIDSSNKKVQNYLYLSSGAFSESEKSSFYQQYVKDELYKTIIGSNEYAESFITSEWLYYSLKDRRNFDYTSVISGYLKSIEQLLSTIVELNLDNTCYISMSDAGKVRDEAVANGIKAYRRTKTGWSFVPISFNEKLKKYTYKASGYIYIEYTADQKKYMDSSIGSFEYFLRNNPKVFKNPYLAKKIADMVCCFRTECRNGFFHTHNLSDWDVVEKTRDNAIYLYYVLLGSCIIPSGKQKELGILMNDPFDELCMKIREFRHYNKKFIFEYEGGEKFNLIYDLINNTVEYTDTGVEHYESLLFYKVDEFSMEANEKLEGISEEQKIYLTRENMPKKIYGVCKDHKLEEIKF